MPSFFFPFLHTQLFHKDRDDGMNRKFGKRAIQRKEREDTCRHWRWEPEQENKCGSVQWEDDCGCAGMCVCACNGLQTVGACEARGHPSLAVCSSVKCHSLTCVDTADVSFEAVTLMWHAKIAILFTHRPTPARQCACCRVSSFCPTCLSTCLWRHLKMEKQKRERERKKNVHCYYNFACCQSRLAMSVNTLCSFSGANRADSYSRQYTERHGGISYNCISTHTHTNSLLQGTTKMWQRTRS